MNNNHDNGSLALANIFCRLVLNEMKPNIGFCVGLYKKPDLFAESIAKLDKIDTNYK